MIKIEQKPFGYKLTFSGIISLKEIEDTLTKSKIILADNSEKFSVLIDMREMEILPVECQQAMYDGQILFMKMGMERSIIVVSNKLTAMQFKLIAQKSGIFNNRRYLNTSLNHNWEKEALNWLLNSVEPSLEEELVK